MNKKYSELAELFRSEKTDEEILDFLLNYLRVTLQQN